LRRFTEINAHPSQIGLGANAAPGDIRYVDVNGDNIDAKDRTNLESDSKSDDGFNLQMNYKSLDLAVFTFASVGNDMVKL
jgi:hypothetical protein